MVVDYCGDAGRWSGAESLWHLQFHSKTDNFDGLITTNS